MYLGMQWKMVQLLGPLTPMWKIGLRFQAPAFCLAVPGSCGHLGSVPSLYNCLSNKKKINLKEFGRIQSSEDRSHVPITRLSTNADAHVTSGYCQSQELALAQFIELIQANLHSSLP